MAWIHRWPRTHAIGQNRNNYPDQPENHHFRDIQFQLMPPQQVREVDCSGPEGHGMGPDCPEALQDDCPKIEVHEVGFLVVFEVDCPGLGVHNVSA